MIEHANEGSGWISAQFDLRTRKLTFRRDRSPIQVHFNQLGIESPRHADRGEHSRA
jgi:hypothetical protein